MGWLRLAGSLKLYDSFAEYRLFCRALLQKRLIILRSLLIVATPYPYLYVWYYQFICVTWLIHSSLSHDSLWRGNPPISLCDNTPYPSYITWLVYLCDMTQSSMSQDSWRGNTSYPLIISLLLAFILARSRTLPTNTPYPLILLRLLSFRQQSGKGLRIWREGFQIRRGRTG